MDTENSQDSEERDQFEEESKEPIHISGYQSDMDTLDQDQYILPEYVVDILEFNSDEVLSIKKNPKDKN